jgi:hypothetical protein
MIKTGKEGREEKGELCHNAHVYGLRKDWSFFTAEAVFFRFSNLHTQERNQEEIKLHL